MTDFDPTRPRLGPVVYKAHGLGNDYLVAEEIGDPADPGDSGDSGDSGAASWLASPDAVRRICHPHEGIGGDGIVALLEPPATGEPGEGPFRLRMFNPDGGEFERSGNGLRVLASHLHRTGRVTTGRPFRVEVGGDTVEMTVHGRDGGGRYDVSVAMGRARTGAEAVAADPSMLGDGAGIAQAFVRHPGIGDVPVWFVSVGNPHCVVFSELNPDGPFGLPELERLGPGLATHDVFRDGINVQIARVVEEGDSRGASRGDAGGASRRTSRGDAGGDAGEDGGEDSGGNRGGGAVEALVWERGVGHTTASGTSACAVAVACVVSERLTPGRVEVRMEGGLLLVDVGPELDVTLRGPVEEVFEATMADGFRKALGG